MDLKNGSITKLGQEYIVECTGEEFHDQRVYFVCLLCQITKKYSRLDFHLTSLDHQIKFLVSGSYLISSFLI